jgi:hypothetical protein
MTIRLTIAIALVVLPFRSPAAFAQSRMTPEPVAYTLRFPEARNHYVEVEASVPAAGPAAHRDRGGGPHHGAVPGLRP